MSLLNSDNVLVLNSYYLAIKVFSAKDAITALVGDRAQVIDDNYIKYNFHQWVRACQDMIVSEEVLAKYSGVIRSPSTVLIIPQVIMFPNTEFVDMNTSIRYSRKNILERDAYTCQYCEKRYDRSNLTLDHVIPKSKGGKSTWLNIVTACKLCNQKKGNRLLSELKWTLRKAPHYPRWKSHIGTPFKLNKKQYWEKFLT